jgi:hypothetical protein
LSLSESTGLPTELKLFQQNKSEFITVLMRTTGDGRREWLGLTITSRATAG